MTIQDRIKLWREDAAVLRRRGARRAAALMERLAEELEADVSASGGAVDVPELVDMAAAVALSGYTRGHLRRMLVARTLTNYGTEPRPLFRAADLPRKPGAVRLQHQSAAGLQLYAMPTKKTHGRKGREEPCLWWFSLAIDASTRNNTLDYCTRFR